MNIRFKNAIGTELLGGSVREESDELIGLLSAYRTAMRTEFGTKMGHWKAHRIYDIS